MSEKLDQLWNDEANWGGGMYRCKEDPRLIVRGHGATLYTVNAAHGAAWAVLVASLILIAAP